MREFLLGTSYAEADILAVVAYDILQGVPTDKLIDIFTRALREAAEHHNDDACYRGLDLLKYAYLEKYGVDSHGAKYRKALQQLYSALPDGRLSKTKDKHIEPTLLQTKARIIQEVIKDWHWNLDRGREAFDFVIGCFESVAEQDGIPRRFVSEVEKASTLKLIAEHLKQWHSPNVFEVAERFDPWIQFVGVPEAIGQVLASLRTQFGGYRLAQRDVGYADLLSGVPKMSTPSSFKAAAGSGKI